MHMTEGQAHLGCERLAGLRQAYPARRTLEQLDANGVLERMNRAAHRRLTRAKPGRGSPEVQFVRQIQEDPHLAYVEFRQF